VPWARKQPVEPPPAIAEIVSLLTDLGGILMGIDAKLQLIVTLMEAEDDDGD